MKSNFVYIRTDGVRGILKDGNGNEIEGVKYYSVCHTAGELPEIDISFACHEQLKFEGEARVVHHCGLGPIFRKHMSKAAIETQLHNIIDSVGGERVSKKKREKMVGLIVDKMMTLNSAPVHMKTWSQP